MVRAKFRVMEISHFFNGDGTKVRLLPVMAKSPRFPDDKDVSEENAAFWDATPSGEAGVSMAGMADASFVLGSCYYIDMEPREDGAWTLDVVSHTAHQRDITLRLPWGVRPKQDGSSMRQATVQMNIGNQSAWAAFEGPGAGSKWSVRFSAAPG